MTENEAIKEFNIMIGKRMRTKNGISEKQHELFQMAMDGLEELQQYRSIGTVEECREAVERQKPKTPYIWGDGYDEDGNMIYDMYDCPNCGSSYEIECDHYKHCPECGQAMNMEGLMEG